MGRTALWLLAAPGFMALVYLFLVSPNVKRKKARMLGEWYFAHRGLHGEGVPENSLAAFQRAKEAGYGIELDVHRTADGRMVVHHDDDLERTCGEKRNISRMTLEEIRRFRLFGTEEKIPTLEEVLSLVDGRVPLMIEMKTDARARKELPPMLYERMRAYRGVWCVESFDPRMLRWFRRRAPGVIRGQLAFDPSRAPGDPHRGILFWCGARLLMNFLSRPDFISYQFSTEGNLSFRAVRRLFQPVLAAWTVRSPSTSEKLKRSYCIQIFEGFKPDHPSRPWEGQGEKGENQDERFV